MRVIANMNGVMVAYAMGAVNAALAMVVAFGVNLSESQQGTVTAFVNAALVLIAHVSYSQAKRTKTVIPAPPVDESETPK